MADELKIWALREGDEAEPVEGVTGVNLENTLEETLVQRPEMLENGLHLVGRQMPTESGPLDLLGVDAGGRLVVFELKREKLTREAVTQCIDYASALSSKTPEELGELVAEHSGTGGIDEIDDFEEWYQGRFAENEPSDLLPPRLALVGVGVDERAERMARFLSGEGVDISVVTFYGFEHGGQTLLARQVEVERDSTPQPGRGTGQSAAEKRLALQARLAEKGLTDLFEDIASTLRGVLPESSQKSGSWGINYGLPSGGGRRRFCHLWVAEVGARVEWFSTPENYGEDALDSLGAEAERCGWLPMKGGYCLEIADIERWREVRDSLKEFVTTALAAWKPAPQDGNFRDLVWTYIRQVPRGRVVTYGQIAEAVNSPQAAQAVGSSMAALPDETDVPWHRVVTAEGQLGAPQSLDEQRERLRDEGVIVHHDDRVDLDKHQWSG